MVSSVPCIPYRSQLVVMESCTLSRSTRAPLTACVSIDRIPVRGCSCDFLSGLCPLCAPPSHAHHTPVQNTPPQDPTTYIPGTRLRYTIFRVMSPGQSGGTSSSWDRMHCHRKPSVRLFIIHHLLCYRCLLIPFCLQVRSRPSRMN